MVKQFKKLDGDILLTTACPVDCDFCIYGCVHKGEWMPEETIERVAKEYTENDVGIRICGGEPFYDLGKLEKCIDIVLKYQQPHEVLLITSGFFGGNKKLTEKAIKLLVDKKLDTLLVSSDRFHLKRVPLSSLVNVIQEAKKQKLKIILRITTDEKSYELMDELAEIIVKHQIRFEPHEEFGVYGKAELLEKNLRDNRDKRKNYLNKKIIEAAEKQNKSTFLNHYIEISPKRSQKEFAARFYPTTFPNGNIYADSQCAKGSFMGNINENSLSDLIKKFSKTLPGHILLSKRSDCASRMKKLNPPNTDTCDYCRNQPLVENTQKEAIGRQLVILDSTKNLDEVFEKIKKEQRELLLSFHLEEKDLNRTKGKEILNFLNKLKQNNLRFILSRALPRCLFGTNYSSITKEFNIPKNCYECRELFNVKNEEILSCKPINKKGPKIYYMEDRNKIWEYFDTLNSEKTPADTCRKCRYWIRKSCNGLCFRK